MLQNRGIYFHISWFLPTSVPQIGKQRESMNFRFQNINYNIVAGDYVILANMSLASGFSESDDYNAVTMGLSKQFVMSMERLRERLTD